MGGNVMESTKTDLGKCVCGHEAEAHCREWSESGPATATKYGLGSCGWIDDDTRAFCTCGEFSK